MARNVEIKARVADPGATWRRIEALADGPPETLEQRDTFFRIAAGRLKLREIAGRPAELIFYERADTPDPVESHYERVAVSDAPALRGLLAAALGAGGEVVKRRLLFHTGRTRIHLDDVQRLGWFLELEVQLADGEAPETGKGEAARIMAALAVEPSALVSEAYVDLLARNESDAASGQMTGE